MAMALKGLVGLTGLLLAVMGVRWMFAPVATADELGITLDGVAALNTARGDLGGMFIAGAALCAIGLRTGVGQWLQAVAVLIGCVALGRVVGMATDGFSTSSLTPFIVELLMVSVLLAAARPSGVADSG